MFQINFPSTIPNLETHQGDYKFPSKQENVRVSTPWPDILPPNTEWVKVSCRDTEEVGGLGGEGIQESLHLTPERCDQLSVSKNHEDFPPPSAGHPALSQPGLQGKSTKPDYVSGSIFQSPHNQRDSGLFWRRTKGRTEPLQVSVSPQLDNL